MLIYTDHAKERMQQRGISELAIELINRYGTVRHTKGGRYRYFDNQNKKKVKKAVMDLAKQIEKLEKMYFFEGEEGVVVTVGHLTEPVRNGYNHSYRRAKARSKASR